MSILVDSNTRLLTQGITGAAGKLHTLACRAYGTNVVGGVSPGKGGTDVEGIPVFDTVRDAVEETGANATMVFVPAPDVQARERILSMRLAKRPTAATLDLKGLAQRTDGFSGADLAGLVDAATELAFERTVEAGREHPVDDALLAQALKDARPSTQPWLETARNYALYANEGGSYDELLAYLKSRRLA